MQPITGCLSLSPRSHARSLDSFPYESPATAQILRTSGEESGFPRSHTCRPECSRACPFSACLSPGSACDDVLPMVTEATGCVPFWFGPDSRFGPAVVTGFKRQFTYVAHAELAWHLTPHGGWQCRFRPRHRGEPSNERHVVSRASHPTVTSHACPDRQLLVVQQVTAPQSMFRPVGVTRQGRALPTTTCRMTRGRRRHVSHHQFRL